MEIYRINNYAVKSKGKLVEELDSDKTEILKSDKPKNSTSDENIKSDKDRKRSLRDARNRIIRLISANPDMTTFITLTFAQESDYKESKKMLNNFFTKLRRDFKGLKYLWVLEYGDLNHRLHYHLLCNIPIGIKLSQSNEKKSDEHKQLEQWFYETYWSYGWVDIRSLNQEGNSNIALYLSTYIVKSMSNIDLEGYRIYGYSNKTLNKPHEIKLCTKESIEEVLLRYKNRYRITYSNSYSIGYADYKGEHYGSVTYVDMMEVEHANNSNNR